MFPEVAVPVHFYRTRRRVFVALSGWRLAWTSVVALAFDVVALFDRGPVGGGVGDGA